jgi:hypothetical protein
MLTVTGAEQTLRNNLVSESVPKVGDIPKTGGIITDSRVFGRKNALEMAGICPMAAKIEFVQTYGTDSQTPCAP